MGGRALNNKEKVILFGAGKIGRLVARMLRYDKEVLYIVDNDSSKHGHNIEGYLVYPVDKLLENKDITVVIAVGKYAPIVIQLDSMGIRKYIWYADIYGWQYDCKSRVIMDRHVAEKSMGQYVGRDIKNDWMNHMICPYGGKRYERYLKPEAKVLDVGCGCGTFFFWELLNGFDSYGLECCNWKIDFCKQKIEDFHFPLEWKEKLIFGYGEKLPFEDNCFDVVTSWYVLEHVNDWSKCLKEMVRVVKPGGSIFINAPDYRNSYEEHYGIDIGRPISEAVSELKEKLIERHESLEIFEELNFITKPLLLNELKKYDVTIIDKEDDGICVERVEGRFRIRRRIDLIVQKNG